MGKNILINCSAEGNGGDGLHIAANASANVEGFISKNNKGHGIYIGNQDLSKVKNIAELYEMLGLAKEYSSKELADDLHILSNVPAEKQKQIVESDGFTKKFKGYILDYSTLAANLITIASSEYLPGILHFLQNIFIGK